MRRAVNFTPLIAGLTLAANLAADTARATREAEIWYASRGQFHPADHRSAGGGHLAADTPAHPAHRRSDGGNQPGGGHRPRNREAEI